MTAVNYVVSKGLQIARFAFGLKGRYCLAIAVFCWVPYLDTYPAILRSQDGTKHESEWRNDERHGAGYYWHEGADGPKIGEDVFKNAGLS